MLIKETFSGSPYRVGLSHGLACRQTIASNLSLLVQLPNNNIPRNNVAEAEKWFRGQRERHYDLWPWIAEEIRGISKGCGLPLELIEKLNFRIWQYRLYGKGSACASFISRAKDGTLITGGVLDDPRELYCFSEVQPKRGFRYLSFPIAGTCWANRGINEEGLALGLSSLPLPGLRFISAELYQQDICFRVILQTCRSIREVRDFCSRFPFFMNAIVVDREGNSLVMAITDQGPIEYLAGTTCLTNHPLPSVAKILKATGYNGSIPSETSTVRLKTLVQKIRKNNGSLTLNKAKQILADRKEWPNGVNNPMTAFATIAQPQKHPKMLLVCDKPITVQGFRKFQFD